MGPQRLPLHWQDSEGQSDEGPVYGGYQTSLSEETVLASLAETLKNEDIKALGIMASDPWDVTFLIHWFTQAAPNVRLFVRDVDLLYLRTPDVGSVTGVLAVSDYPLIDEDQFWASNGLGRRPLITLPSSLQEGEYNAFSMVIGQLKPGNVQPGRRPLEGMWPYDKQGASPFAHLWLAASGTQGFLPIQPLPPTSAKATGSFHVLNVGKPPYSAILLWFLIAIIGVAHGLGVIIAGREKDNLAHSSEGKDNRSKWDDIIPPLLTLDLEDRGDAITAAKFIGHSIALSTIAFAGLVAGSTFLFFAASTYRSPLRVPTYGVLAAW